MISYRLITVFLTIVPYISGNDADNAVLNNFSGGAFQEYLNLIEVVKEDPSAVFPKCERKAQKSNFTRCMGSSGKTFVDNATYEMVNAGCLPPSVAQLELINGAIANFVDKEQLAIIEKRLSACGKTCERKFRCCGAPDKFLHQGIQSYACSPRACTVDELTTEEQNILGVSEPCAMDQVAMPDWNLVQRGTAIVGKELAQMNKQMMCSMFKTTLPRLNCKKSGNSQCKCCCHDKKVNGNFCVGNKQDKEECD